jgi:hypothetical protein
MDRRAYCALAESWLMLLVSGLVEAPLSDGAVLLG